MLAKEELGADAVVMNVKTNAPKGIYKLFRKTTVEITAALDENIVYQSKKEAPKRQRQRLSRSLTSCRICWKTRCRSIHGNRGRTT